MDTHIYEIEWDRDHEMPWRVVRRDARRPGYRFVFCRCFTRNDAVEVMAAMSKGRN